MSYSQSLTVTKETPFAMLTRETYLAGDAQWSTQSQTWINSVNSWQGKGLMFGMATCLSTAHQIIASTKFNTATSRHTFASQWSANGETRVSQDDLMLGYGSSAAWSTDTRFAGLTYSMDHTRARCMVMRTSQ